MVDTVDMNRRKNSRANKIGSEEDRVNREEVSQATLLLNASSVASMVIMQKSENQLSASIVVVWRKRLSI